jgi:zinc protease
MSPLAPVASPPRFRSSSWVSYLARLSVVCMMGCHAPTARGPSTVPARQAEKPPRPSEAANWRFTVPNPTAESAWTYPVPTVTTLSNQLTVYVLQHSVGPVSLSLLIRHGGSDVPPEKSGLASMAAQMLAEATKTKNHYALSEAAESLGSTLTGEANRDYVHLTLDTLPEDVSNGIDLLAETLTAPAFDRADFLRLQKQHLDDLVSERQVPARLASLVGLRAVLGERLGTPVGGRLTSIRHLTIEDVRRWHRTYVYPEAVALVVVGPVDPSAVLAAVEKTLGKLRGTRPNLDAPIPEPPPDSTAIYVVDRPSAVQSALFVAQAYPKRQQPGYAARQVLDNIIGGQFTSRINHNLREQHAYTYGAHSMTIAARHFGLLTVSTNVETEVTAPAIVQIVKELRELRAPNAPRPIGADELHRARTGVIQSLGSHLEDGHRLLLDLEQLFVHDLAPTHLGDYLSEVRQVDGSMLVAESERLAPERLAIVIVGDLSRVRAQLTAVGLSFVLAPSAWLD